MFYSKAEKLKYLGFNDSLFFAIGSVVLALIISFLFNSRIIDEGLHTFNVHEFSFTFAVSLIFSYTNWFLMRYALIRLRIIYPSIEQSLKRILFFAAAIILSILLVNTIGNFILNKIIGDNFHPMSRSGFLVIIIISTMTMAIYEAIYYQVQLTNAIRKEEQSKQVIVKAKIDALRNQARPHFLFNSFNTLRDIIEHDTKTEARNFVDKLSDVYRFILDTGNSNLVNLQDEVDFAKAYIYIQKERFGKNLDVKWNIDEDLSLKFIVPMSLQLLLENAIKHNVVSKTNPLEINVASEGDTLVVTNKILLKSTKTESTNLGLANIKDRYRLIGNTLPSISTKNGIFKVVLPLFHQNLAI